MLPRHADPIVAVATAAGRGAVGIVRISGQDLARYVVALLGRSLRPREASYLPFRGADGVALDHGLALYFAQPQSFTGEDVLELQAHGGPVVLQLLVARCLQVAAQTDAATGAPVLPGLRLAQPGEFSERAFLNGKIDLTQAEAIADLIDASTEAAARGAGRSLSGEFSREVHTLRDALIHLRMLVEATLDFPDEEIDFLEKADAKGQLDSLADAVQSLMARAQQGALLREGIRVVIAGQPNAGKSSLLNALAGAELAIVTPVPGTTRDKVTQVIQIDGVPVHVIDTAGLRHSDDEVERIGIARAWSEIGQADAVLFLRDWSRANAADYLAADDAIAHSLVGKLAPQVPVLEVWNKADVPATSELPQRGTDPTVPLRWVGSMSLSAKTRLGLDQLRQQLLLLAGWQATPDGVFLARERHVQALQRVAQHLAWGQAHWVSGADQIDLLAEELRLSQNALNEITGAFGADDLLGVIFSSFCIGK